MSEGSGSGEVAERSKALRQGRNLFGGVGSNPTLVTAPFSMLKGTTTSRVAQWSARWAHNPQVVGSKPTSATLRLLNPAAGIV